MKIWLTMPHDDDGIKQIETIGEPTNEWIVYDERGLRIGLGGRIEGEDWHRTKESAVAAAVKYRAERIAKCLADFQHISALPPITL